MPTYEYECRACGRRFEEQQGMTETPVAKCPKCGGEVRRLISGGSGFIMKGDRDRVERKSGSCALEATGHTCCGRDERCGKPPCGGARE